MGIGKFYVFFEDEYSNNEQKKVVYLKDSDLGSLFELNDITYDRSFETEALTTDEYEIYEVVVPYPRRRKRNKAIQFTRSI